MGQKKKKGQRPKQTFLQRRHTDDQEPHEKMFNITNQQRNENQNHNENFQITNNGEGVEKRNPSYGGNAIWCSHYGKQYKTKNRAAI